MWNLQHSLYALPLVSVIAACDASSNGGAPDVERPLTDVSVAPSESDAKVEVAPPSIELHTEFIDTEGQQVGSATLTSLGRGVAIEYSISGLDAGLHGFHIHETATCEPPQFASAGGHLAPFDSPHGDPTAAASQHHAGDMQNQQAGTDGRMRGRVVNDDVVLSGGDRALIDGDGAALVVHAEADDFQSQPAGDAGRRVACAPLRADMIDLSTLPGVNPGVSG